MKKNHPEKGWFFCSYPVLRNYLLSLEKESSKETSKKTKISKRQKPTLYGNNPENERVHFRGFPALAGAVSAAGLCPATFAL
ncbi:MAG: hypothetical protein E7647_04970 [Ruminococcaceae bacterium]|nr:hypothetical protein [Oscillospiraceae bacterium]